MNDSNCFDLRNVVSILLSEFEYGLDDKRPFEGEDEYWNLVKSRQKCLATITSIGPISDHVLFAAGNPEAIGHLNYIVAELTRRENQLQKLWLARRNATPLIPSAPRILRFADRVGLSDAELEILHFLVNESLVPRGMVIGAPDAGDIIAAVHLEPDEYLQIFDPKANLNRLGILHVERDILGSPRSRDVKIELPVVKALRGLPLNFDESIVLGVEPLEEILNEEQGLKRSHEPSSHDIEATETDELDPLEPQSVDTPECPDPEETEGDQAGLEFRPEDEESFKPYTSDLDYLEDYQQWFFDLLKWKKTVVEIKDDSSLQSIRDQNPNSLIRQAKLRSDLSHSRIDIRLKATRQAGSWLPRAEILAAKRGLDDFEKNVLLLLTCANSSIEFRKTADISAFGDAEVGEMLFLFFETLEEQIQARKYFYRDAPLIRDSLVTLCGLSFGQDVNKQDIRIDGSMVDHLLGLDSKNSATVEGSHLYQPQVDLDRVILDEDDKKKIVSHLEAYPAFRRERKSSGLDSIIPYGAGIVLLFYGPSGTGKTMLAEALGTHLKKKILLVNLPSLGFSGDDVLRYLFREAKVNNAILFFDECESIFQSRENGGSEITSLLTEIERHDGIVILATNRQLDIDPAMHRRIRLKFKFHRPDFNQREQIWRAHLPPGLRLQNGFDIRKLARRFELTGGLIKNAVLTALSIAVSENSDTPIVTEEMLEEGARLQMHGRLEMTDFEDRLIPRCGLDTLVVPEDLGDSLREIVDLEMARPTMAAEFGFDRDGDGELGNSALFFGPPGTGKSLSAEAIAFELGRPVKRINAAQIVSKWVGQGAKNLQLLFTEARNNEAVLLFDEADALFAGRTAVSNATDRYANLDVSILLQEIERFPGVVILTTNLLENIDPAFRRRIRFHCEFPRPDDKLRLRLWHRHIPSKLPLDKGVSLKALASDFALSGAEIRNVIHRAAARAAIRPNGERKVTMADLTDLSSTELGSNGTAKAIGFS